MRTGRYQHAAAAGPDGRVYAMGGLAGSNFALLEPGGVVSPLEAYDPATNA